MEAKALKHKQKDTNVVSLKRNSAKQLVDNRPKSVVQQKKNDTGLPNNLKSGIENLSGHSMDDVKVHYNSSKPAQLNAHAYAQGTNIHLGAGQEKHLAHEAWHVVQQKQGRVKPTAQLKAKVNINDEAHLEKEADVMGAKALQMKSSFVPIQVPYNVGSVAQLVRGPALASWAQVGRIISLNKDVATPGYLLIKNTRCRIASISQSRKTVMVKIISKNSAYIGQNIRVKVGDIATTGQAVPRQKQRLVTDQGLHDNLRHELLTGVNYGDDGLGGIAAIPASPAAPQTINYVRDYIASHPAAPVQFAFMVRTPNFTTDKLKGVDGHAAVQVFVPGNNNARVQVGLGGMGQIAKEQFFTAHGGVSGKYTITVYRNAIPHNKAMAVLGKMGQDGGTGHAYGRFAHYLRGSINCATWAIEVARVAGFSFPLSYVLGSNPLFLGKGLKESMWKRKEYTKKEPNGKEIDIYKELDDKISSIR